MNNTNIINNQQPLIPQQRINNRIPSQTRGWQARMMNNFFKDRAATLRRGEMTIPNWLTGKAIVFFFVALFTCWGAFGYVPEIELWMVAAISVLLFFYGGQSMSKAWEKKKEKTFLKNVFLVGLIIRLLWILYCYFFFNMDHYGHIHGDDADTGWYMEFGKDLASWLSGNSKYTLSQIIDLNSAAIDDVGYPMWLGIIYMIFGAENDVFIPFILKCFFSAYCAVCVYHIAKRHFGDGVARIAAIFVCVNPNMIYWCGNMFKEAELVFLCCLAIDLMDRTLSSGKKLTFKSLLPGILVGFSLFFFRSALGLIIFLAVFGHILIASGRVMSMGKKILAGVLVAVTLLIGVGDSIRSQTEYMIEAAQSDTQQQNMEWRSRRKDGGNTFAKYVGAAVFAPLIFTIPFPTFNQAEESQLLQVQLSGGSYIKNILSFFVIMVMLMLLISGEWRKHVFILAYTVGYLAILVISSYAQSGRFHMPIWPMFLLFAAYGVQVAKTNFKLRKWYSIVLVIEIGVCLVWNWFKLKGRGMI